MIYNYPSNGLCNVIKLSRDCIRTRELLLRHSRTFLARCYMVSEEMDQLGNIAENWRRWKQRFEIFPSPVA